jgi:hypothetical protein
MNLKSELLRNVILTSILHSVIMILDMLTMVSDS